MPKPKKNGTYLNVCIETSLYQRLETLCDDVGQTKTVAVERALAAYLDYYEKMKSDLKAPVILFYQKETSNESGKEQNN